MKGIGVWKFVVIIVILSLPITLFAQVENWVYRYNGPGHSWDEARPIVYGSDGNIYAAGRSTGSGTSYDFTVISLTTAGDTNWVYRYNGPGNGGDEANSIVYGSDGNIYAAGGSTGSGTGKDFTVISLTPQGTERWVYRYDGPANSMDGAYSVVYGSDGNIYAAGFNSKGIGADQDFVVVSLTSSGTENWIYCYNGPAGAADGARSIVYGSDGNIYAAGGSNGSGTGKDFTVISLTPQGTERWVYRYNGPGNDWDFAYSIVYGSDGNIYAGGWSCGSGTYSDFTVISLTGGGTERWVYRYDDYNDYVYSIVYGSDGNIYAAGCGNRYLYVISLMGSGRERWIFIYTAFLDDGAKSVTYGLDGNIYVAGYSKETFNYYDFLVMSITGAGDMNWVYQYDGPGNDRDFAYSIVYGSDGNLYVAGESEGSGTSADFTVISLNPATGIEEPSFTATPEPNLRITPNPFVTSTTISFTRKGQRAKGIGLRIYDVSGRLIKSIHLTTNHMSLGTKLKPGIYFLKVDGVNVGKVTKVR